ncbi:MAG: hypothetical protein M1816_003801 [Peltula sp. TS41687]|nr:MAG: hypothetical protein M1816_003801 [Peltula sp. TS41687]
MTVTKYPDWYGSLIEPGDDYTLGPPHRPVAFKCNLRLPKPVSKAYLHVTAHGVYECSINGTVVGDHHLAPGWTSYSHRLLYQSLDATDLLWEGDNEIRVEVAEGWYCGRLGWGGGRWNNYGDRIGLMAELRVLHFDGEVTTCATGEAWKWSYSAILSAGIYDGEVYDAMMASSEPPRYNVHCKPIKDNLVRQESPPIRCILELKPEKILKSPSGKTILDLGQNMVGHIRARVNSPSATSITFKHAEALQDGELYTRALRTAKATDVLHYPGNLAVTWEPKFTYHGFRFVQVDGWPGDLQLEDIMGIVVSSDMPRTGFFSCSSPTLNRLHENVVWSMRGNFLGIPTDCPQRDERLGWTGDINMFGPTANFLFSTKDFLSSWLEDLAIEQREASGIVPLTVPNIFEDFVKDAQAVWCDVVVMLPWELYRTYGDIDILRRHYPGMTAWLDAIPRRENGLWNYKAKWKLGDWLDPAAPPDDAGAATTDSTLVSDAFLCHVVKTVGLVASLLREDKDAEKYLAEAEKAHKTFAYEYIAPSGLMVCDTQTAYALAIAFDLIPTPRQLQRAGERLEHIIVKRHGFKIGTGFAGTPYIGLALTRVSRSHVFYGMLAEESCPSFGYPLTMGATTVWERWDSILPDGRVYPGGMTSFNHYAFGSVAHWMHSVIAGLKPYRAGWGRFIVEPVPGGGLQWAQAKYISQYGEHEVWWEIKLRGEERPKRTLWLQVRVPANTTVDVRLFGRPVRTATAGVHEWEFPYNGCERLGSDLLAGAAVESEVEPLPGP